VNRAPGYLDSISKVQLDKKSPGDLWSNRGWFELRQCLTIKESVLKIHYRWTQVYLTRVMTSYNWLGEPLNKTPFSSSLNWSFINASMFSVSRSLVDDYTFRPIKVDLVTGWFWGLRLWDLLLHFSLWCFVLIRYLFYKYLFTSDLLVEFEYDLL
jgi:hypothetical protein